MPEIDARNLLLRFDLNADPDTGVLDQILTHGEIKEDRQTERLELRRLADP